jgi:hypothetical protein
MRQAARSSGAMAPSSPLPASAADFAKPRNMLAAEASPLDEAMAALQPQATASPSGQWLLGDGRRLAHGAAQQQWLTQLRTATAGRWRAGSAADAPEPAPTVILQAEGRTLGSLWIAAPGAGGHTVWRDASGALWLARQSAPGHLMQILSGW